MGTYGNGLIDDKTQAAMNIEYEHHEIHSGSHFFYASYQGLESGISTQFVFTPPASTKEAHLLFSVVGSETTTLEIFKNPTEVAGGTAVSIFNNNGNSANTSESTIVKDPTNTLDGTLAYAQKVGGNNRAGAIDRSKEIILETGATYLLRITSGSNGNTVSWGAEWYEHTPKG